MKLEEFRNAYPEQTVRTNRQEWRYIASRRRETGEAPALVMLPGAFGAAEIFWNQIVTLDGKFRIVSITYPPIDDAKAISDGVVSLMDRLGLDSTSLLGSSLGGYLAQLIALRHTSRVETLFIANSLLTSSDLADPLDPKVITDLTGAELRERIIQSVEAWPATEPAYAKLKSILKSHSRHCLTDTMIKSRTFILATLSELPPLPLSDDHIVVIECEDDPMISAAGRSNVRNRFPDSEQHIMTRGGHFPYITRADEYTSIIAERLGRKGIEETQ